MVTTKERRSEFDRIWNDYCRNNILAFAALMNFDPWSQQREILLNVQEQTLNDEAPKRQLTRAGTGTGKTALVTFACLWRHLRMVNTCTIATAPTERQCTEVFFSELAGHLSRAPRFLRDQIHLGRRRAHVVGHPEWAFHAVTASQETALQGFHRRGMTVAVEELSGIRDSILGAFFRTVTQRDNMMMLIGNPNYAQGLMFEAFHGKKKFWPHRFVLNKLIFSQERPDLCDPEIIESMRQEYGEDSDMFRVACLGEFPLEGGTCVLSSGEVRKAMQVDSMDFVLSQPRNATKRIALDVARFGGDECVLAVRYGDGIVFMEAGVMDPLDAADLGLRTAASLGWGLDDYSFVLDATGMGQSVASYLNRMGAQVVEWHNAARSPNRSYNRLMDHAWFELRNKLRQGDVKLPNDDEAFTQLVTRQYKYLPNQKIAVESKDDYKKRGYSSPDRAEAIIMAMSDHGSFGAADVLTFGDDSLLHHAPKREIIIPGQSANVDSLFFQ